MLNKIRMIGLSALLGLGTFVGVPAMAEAAPGFSVQVQYGHGHNAHRHGHWRGGPRHRPVCSTHQALNKAQRMGIRHVRIHRANRHVISVRGRSHGHPVRVSFARVPGCPIIR